nr:flagellar motor switch protein FliN [candidate division Zixibacteria bacterium]
MDEKNGINLPMDGNPSDEEIKDDAVSGQESGNEPTPEEKEMLAMGAGDAGDESESSPDESSADEGDDNSGEGSELLSQEAIDNALGSAADGMTDDMPEQLQPEVHQADFQQLSMQSENQTPRNIDLLMDVDLPVSIELGRTRMRISDILALGPGSIVELDKLVGEPVDLLVNKKCVARGEVVVVEESFGLRITQLVSPEERLKNLA